MKNYEARNRQVADGPDQRILLRGPSVTCVRFDGLDKGRIPLAFVEARDQPYLWSDDGALRRRSPSGAAGKTEGQGEGRGRGHRRGPHRLRSRGTVDALKAASAEFTAMRNLQLSKGVERRWGVGLAIGYIKSLEKWGQADDGGEVDGLGREEAC